MLERRSSDAFSGSERYSKLANSISFPPNIEFGLPSNEKGCSIVRDSEDAKKRRKVEEGGDSKTLSNSHNSSNNVNSASRLSGTWNSSGKDGVHSFQIPESKKTLQNSFEQSPLKRTSSIDPSEANTLQQACFSLFMPRSSTANSFSSTVGEVSAGSSHSVYAALADSAYAPSYSRDALASNLPDSISSPALTGTRAPHSRNTSKGGSAGKKSRSYRTKTKASSYSPKRGVNFTVAVQGGQSSILLSPCSVCYRRIAQTEVFFRCDGCNYIECIDCNPLDISTKAAKNAKAKERVRRKNSHSGQRLPQSFSGVHRGSESREFATSKTSTGSSSSSEGCSASFSAALEDGHEHQLKRCQWQVNNPENNQPVVANKTFTSEGNRIINDYVVVKMISRGSFATVKLVREVYTEELYALKILKKFKKQGLTGKKSKKSENLESEQKRISDELLREIAVMRLVNHPNIVKLQEVIDDVEEEKIYIIMEYCSGGPIHVLGNPALPVEKARLYGSQLASALLYLHSEFLYHRDVKPANVLVDAKGVAKLVDFGTCNSRTRTNMAAGTPAYSCPELVRGEEVSGEVVDSWAFAVTLFQMAYGKLPFSDAATVYSLRNFLLSDAPIVVPPHPADRAIEDLLRRMLNKDRRNRIVLKEAVKHAFFTLHNPLQGAMRGTIMRSRGPKGEPALSSSSGFLPESMLSFPANLSMSMGSSMPALGGMGANEALREIALSTVRRGRKVGEAMSTSVFASPVGASVPSHSGIFRNSVTSNPSTSSTAVPGRMRSPTISLMDVALTTVRKGRNLRETMTRRRMAPDMSVVQASESPSKQNLTPNSTSTRDSSSKRESISLSPPKSLLPSNLYGIGKERKMSSSICSSSSGSISTILSSLLSSPDDAPAEASPPVRTDTSGGGGGIKPLLSSSGKSADGKGTGEKSRDDRHTSAATSSGGARPPPVIDISSTVCFMAASDTIHHGYANSEGKVVSPDAESAGKRYALHTRRTIRIDSCDSDATLSSSGKGRIARVQQLDEKDEDRLGDSGKRDWDKSSRVKRSSDGVAQTNGKQMETKHHHQTKEAMATGAATHLAQSHMGMEIDPLTSPVVVPLSLKDSHPTSGVGAGGENDGARPQRGRGRHMGKGTEDDDFHVDHRRSSGNDSLLLRINANRYGRRKKHGDDHASNRKTEVSSHGEAQDRITYPQESSNLHDIELLQRTPSTFPDPPAAMAPTVDIFSIDLDAFSEILRVPLPVPLVAGAHRTRTTSASTDGSAASVPPRGEVSNSDSTERKDVPPSRHALTTAEEKHLRSHSPPSKRQKARPPPLQLLRNLKLPSHAGGDPSGLTSSNPAGDFDLRSPFQPARPPHGAPRQMGKSAKGPPPPSRGAGNREEVAGTRIGPSPLLKRGGSPFFPSPHPVASSSTSGEGNGDVALPPPPPSRGSPRPLTRSLPHAAVPSSQGVAPPALRPRTRSSRAVRVTAHSVPGAGESAFSVHPASPPRGIGKPLASRNGTGGVRPGSRVGLGMLSPLATVDAAGQPRGGGSGGGGGGFQRRGPSVPHHSPPLASLTTTAPISALSCEDAGKEWGGNLRSPPTHPEGREGAEKEVGKRHGILPGPALQPLPPPPPAPPAVLTESGPQSILGAVGAGPPQGRYRHRQPLVHIVESGEDEDRFPDLISYSVLKKQSSLCSGGSSAVTASTPLSTNGISSGSERESEAGQHEDELLTPRKRLLGAAVVKFSNEGSTRTGSALASGRESPLPPQMHPVSSFFEAEPAKGANPRPENDRPRRRKEGKDAKVEYTETKAPPPNEQRTQRSASMFFSTKETGGAVGPPALVPPKVKKEEPQKKSRRNNEPSRSRGENVPKAALTATEGNVLVPPPSR